MRRLLAFGLAFGLPLMSADLSWERLKDIRPGERVLVDYAEGKKVKSLKGTALSWTEDSLGVRVKSKDMSVPRADVRKVRVYRGKSRGRGAAWGFLIGAAAGFGLFGTAAAAEGGDSIVPVAPLIGIGALVCSGIGGGIGALIGAARMEPVYEAPKQPRQ